MTAGASRDAVYTADTTSEDRRSDAQNVAAKHLPVSDTGSVRLRRHGHDEHS